MIPLCKQKTQLESRIIELEKKQQNEYNKLEILNGYFESDLNAICKCGKVVRVNFRGKVIKEIPNSTPVLKLSDIPAIDECIYVGVGERYHIEAMEWAYIQRTGEICLKQTGLNKYIHINFVYITK